MSFAKYSSMCPVVAILRGITPDEMIPVCDVLYEAGIRVLEVPLNSPEACESIRLASEKYHSNGTMLIGAGTVLSVEDVQRVAAAGGKFIISPDTNADVIRETKRLGLVSIPGFFTPTEGFAALRAGADYLKLFPAGVNGISYIKDLQAVIKAPILAVGGVNENNIPDFLKLCQGVGIGSALYKPGKTLEEIKTIANKMVQAASCRK